MSWRLRPVARWKTLAGILRNPTRGAELGVKEGRFMSYLMGEFPDLHMIGVDLFAPRPLKERPGYETYDEWDWDGILDELKINTDPFVGRFELIQKDTRAAAQEIEDDSLDFVFIDAEHTYEGVSGDIEAWARKVKPGGIVSGHDYNEQKWPGVWRAVNEYCKPKTGGDAVWYVRKPRDTEA